jgi:hypothetical protein
MRPIAEENAVPEGFASQALGAVLFFSLLGPAGAAPRCAEPQETVAVRTAALQQEMMVAAFNCRDVAAYNRFVLAHRSELQDADRTLLNLFLKADSRSGTDGYNLYKTELANASSLRSARDPRFCRRIDADFDAAFAHPLPLDQLLTTLPYPIETGSVYCTAALPQTTPARDAPSPRLHPRTWLGRLVDAVFH